MSIVLQNKPKLFGMTQRKLMLYVIPFAAFFALPYLLFDWSWYYYGAAFIVLIAFNITFNKQLNNLYSLIVYYVAKKRIRS